MSDKTLSPSSDNLTSLFQPDTLLSAQYFDSRRSATLPEAERRLMLAILQDAIACYRDYLFSQSGKGKRLFDDAETWIMTADADWIFSFDHVCQALGINSEYVRRGLLRWKEKQRAHHAGSSVGREKQLAS